MNTSQKSLLPQAGRGPTPLATQEVATLVNGTLIGDPNIIISRICHPTDYEADGDLALAMDKTLLPLLSKKNVRAAVISHDADLEPGTVDAAIIVERPRLALAKLTQFFSPLQTEPLTKANAQIHPTALIDDGVQLGANVTIGAYTIVAAGTVLGDDVVLSAHVTVGPNCVIGAGTRLRAGVRLGDRVQIGSACIVHQNTVIGSDGFSFVTPEMGSVESAKKEGEVLATNSQGYERIYSLGAVIIGDNVEIGAGTTIDRGTVAVTRIGRGTKIDNKVQIGHNVQIGEDCLICGGTGIAGSAVIGNRVVLGGAVGVADHIRIGDDVVALGMAGVASTIPPKSIVAGYPAIPRDKHYQNYINLNRLRIYYNKVNDLAERLEKLEKAGKND